MPSHDEEILDSRDSVNATAAFELQHATERTNPFKDLRAPLKTTKQIVVHKRDPNLTADAAKKRGSIMTQTGILTATNSIIPPILAIAIADVCEELGIPCMMLRITAAAIAHLAHAPKPPAIKFKTGKGGISDAVIPYDESTTTQRDKDGKIVALAQNQKYKPTLNHEIGTMQYPIPLEKIILGLNKNPPEFILATSDEDLHDSGELKVRVNSDDPAIASIVYKINLNDTNQLLPLESSKNRTSPAADAEPGWWKSSWGDFNQVVQNGFQLSYQKQGDAEFSSFEVYSRNDNEKQLMVTGDQDLHSIPRSVLYHLGNLAIDKIDSHEPGGITELSNKIIEVHKEIITQKLQIMETELQNKIQAFEAMVQDPALREAFRVNETAMHEEKMDNFLDMTTNISQFLESSRGYVRDLGLLTPFEAYALIKANLRQVELTELCKVDAQSVLGRLDQVLVTETMGLDAVLEKKLDIDLNEDWFSEDHDPEGSIKHVKSQLELNRTVPGDNALPYMKALEKYHPEEGTTLEQKSKNAAVVKSSRDPGFTNATIEMAKQIQVFIEKLTSEGPRPDVYVTNLKGELQQIGPDTDLKSIGPLRDLLVISESAGEKQIAHFNGNKIRSSAGGEAGVKHIHSLFEKAGLNSDNLVKSTPQPVTPTAVIDVDRQVEHAASMRPK